MADPKNKIVAILGIDASTTSSGVALLVYDGEKKPKLKHYELIVPQRPKKKKGEKIDDYNLRCSFILDGICSLLDGFLIEYPDLIIGIELLNSKQNMEVTRQLAGLWGYITNSIYVRYSKKVISVNTKEIKKLVTGNGSADKEEMVKHINRLFKTKFTFDENDIADSIGTAMLTYRKINGEDRI